MGYSVKLHAFEGPLDLLLHLIQKNDLDLQDIPVKEITDQYMTYIHAMQVLELNVASEYLVMASTLLHMKSQLLLPIEENSWDEEILIEEEEITKDNLLDKLKEYKQFKEAAGSLKEKEMERSELFTKPVSDLTPLMEEAREKGETHVRATVYDMLKAFNRINKRKKQEQHSNRVTKVAREEIPIEKKMEEVLLRLNSFKGETLFSRLFERKEKQEMVVTFLALLELMKADRIVCMQDGHYEDIKIKQKAGGTPWQQ